MTRRDLMRGAVAAAFPIGRVAAAEPVGPVMAKLSAYLSEAQGRALPPEVIEKAKHHICASRKKSPLGARNPVDAARSPHLCARP